MTDSDITGREYGELRGLEVDHSAGDGREACKPPSRRRHEDYRDPRWATCHVDGVDHVFATAVGHDGTPHVRVDLDGVGDHGASLHDAGENINLSIYLTPEQIGELVGALADADLSREVGP
jgi:hypothetical protein